MSEEILQDKRVLYVEDDHATREEVAFFLQKSVRKLYTAPDGAEGLRLYQQYRPDLVITDIQMPVMDGLEMIKSIKAMDQHVPVLVTTAYYETDYLLKAVNMGVDRYLLKPLDLMKTLDEMRGVLSEQEAASLCLSLDEQDDVLDANQSLLDYLGYEREEFVGKPIASFIVAEISEDADRVLRLRNGSPFRLRDKGGDIVQAVLGTASSLDSERKSMCTHYELKTIETFILSEQKIVRTLERERFLRGLIMIHAMIGRAVVSASTKETFLQEVTDIFVRDIDYGFAFIGLSQERRFIKVFAQSDSGTLDLLDHIDGRLDIIEDRACPSVEAVRKKRIVIIDEISRMPDFPVKKAYEAYGVNAMISLPIRLITQDEPLGVLTLLFEDANTYGSEELELFENIADTIAFGIQAIEDRIEKERLIIALDIQATTDALTGCVNRHKGIVIAKEEVKRAHRYERPLTLVFLDIDHFKSINDTYGHDRGDEVLKAVAESIRKVIRSSDSAVRWGGEEFLVILPESSMQNAVTLAQKVRKEMETIVFGETREITASFGVAQLLHEESWDSLVTRADDLMSQGKQRGRDCIVHD